MPEDNEQLEAQQAAQPEPSGEAEQPTQPEQPEQEPSFRHCPVCGARVAGDAETCLVCGTDLTAEAQEEDAEEETPARKRLKLTWWMIVIMVVVALAVLAGSVILGLRLGEGSVPTPELPTFTPTITLTPTVTATPTLTPTPTLTSTPVDTPTPLPPLEYQVQEGDTLGAISLEFDISIEEIMAYNDMEPGDFIVVGQVLFFPPPEATPGPTPTLDPSLPTPTQEAMRVYRVQSGDTLSDIAEAFSISVAAIRTANDIPEGSEDIQVGQALVIPLPTPTPVHATATPVVEEPTPSGVLSWPAPAMLFPPDGEVYIGTERTIVLQWASVGILDEREYYGVELVLPDADGGFSTVTYYTRSTIWRISEDLLPDAENEYRTFSWRVHVARQLGDISNPRYRIISTSVRRRSFTWEAEQ